jgi:L-alanine-DL-glutamate epimerase-like enolase superfamily enzyme
MNSILKKILEGNRQMEKAEAETTDKELKDPCTGSNRRSFLKKTALGGISLAGLTGLSFEDAMAQTTSKVNRASSPSELKITDMRYALTTVLGGTAIIRIDTNQGIYGLGEVRDGGDPRYALMLKSRILGQNPCNVEMIFKTIRQFGGPARQAGGVCGVEMALWDLCGKAYNVPAWQLLGGRYRDKIRIYADTPEAGSPEEQLKLIRYRTETQGYTWLKMDVGIEEIAHIPGTLVNQKFWQSQRGTLQQYGDLGNPLSYGSTRHPFTQIQITEKGLEEMAKIVESVRNMVGYDIPLSSDHFGHFDLNNGIRLGKALEKYRLAWMEDLVSWEFPEQWKTITDTLDTPTNTGEDIYLLQNFKPLIDIHATDIIHPDLASSGGLLETKRIGDYAEEHGVAMAMHQAGTPVSFMANVHCAAATQNFLAMEHHSIDLPWWEGLVKTTDGRQLITRGFANLPLSAPGLGIELNEEQVKQHLSPRDNSFFAPTTEWDAKRAHDRTFS